MPLTLELRVGDSVRIGASTTIRVEKSGSRPRVSFDTAEEVKLIRRKEPEQAAPTLPAAPILGGPARPK